MPEDSVDDLYKLGFDCIRLGDYADGLQAFLRANVLCPNDHEILHLIGTALVGLGRYEEAANRIEAAVRLFPQFPDALSDLGDCLAKLGRRKDAKLAYQQALEFLLPGEDLRIRVETSLDRL